MEVRRRSTLRFIQDYTESLELEVKEADSMLGQLDLISASSKIGKIEELLEVIGNALSMLSDSDRSEAERKICGFAINYAREVVTLWADYYLALEADLNESVAAIPSLLELTLERSQPLFWASKMSVKSARALVATGEARSRNASQN